MGYVTFDDTHTFGGDAGPRDPVNSRANASECSYEVTVRNGADDFSASTPINAPACWVEGSNVGATVQNSESTHAGREGGASVWWAWTAPATGTAEFTTVGSSFDTLLAVYSVSANSRTEVASNDDIDYQNDVYQSAVEFDAQEGQRYYIAVDGYNGATGDIVLRWRVKEAMQVVDDAKPKFYSAIRYTIVGFQSGRTCPQRLIAGVSTGHATREQAQAEALSRCRTASRSVIASGRYDDYICIGNVLFGSAYATFGPTCAAVAYGENGLQCGHQDGVGNSRAEAENRAIANCGRSLGLLAAIDVPSLIRNKICTIRESACGP